jgi:hypothetical protein
MIEFSNEVWNGTFSQEAYARQQGESLNLDPGKDAKSSFAGVYWYSLRSAQMFDIWDDVWGPDRTRLVRVLSGMQGWARESEAVLAFRDASRKADVLAVGAYAGPFGSWRDFKSDEDFARLGAMTPDDVLRSLDAQLGKLADQLAANRAVAVKYGKPMVVYEGNIDWRADMVPKRWQPQVIALFSRTLDDPKVEAAYERLLDVVAAHDVGLYMHFEDVGARGWRGAYGALQWQDQDPRTSPIYEALIDVMSKRPPALDAAAPQKLK